MASRVAVLVVFIIPAIASVILSSAVMAQILQEPRAGGDGISEHVVIIGLEPAYSAPAQVEAYVHVLHSAFDCGDLYIKIRDRDTLASLSHDGFFVQCFAKTNTMIPIGGAFVTEISEPGTYEFVATIQDAHKRNTASAVGVFTVG